MHHDNLIFILLIAMAALFRLLTSKAGGSTRKPPPGSTSQPRTNEPRSSTESDQERIRRFLEALGQPTSSTPPTPIAPRPTYKKPILLPRTPSIGSSLPPLTTRPPDLPGEMPPPLPRPASPVKSAPASVPAVPSPVFEVHTSVAAPAETMPFRPTLEPAESSVDLVNLLGSPSALRHAIILREIIGLPRGLRPLD